MDGLSQFNTMLQQIQAPAFRVENGVITHVNQAASAYLIEVGQDFAPMILSGKQEYGDFSEGNLYLTVSLAGICIGAHISSLEKGNLVTLEQPAESPELRVLVLAAKTLKEPLSDLMSIADQMLPAVASQTAQLEHQSARLQQQLYKMMRILNNMSDAAGYVQAQPNRMETVEICSFLEEILEKVAASMEGSTSVRYELPNTPIFTLADREKLERSVYNLLSNAIKTASQGTSVLAKLVSKNNRLYFSVSNTHPDYVPPYGFFNRYLRNPAQLEHPKNGLGLGMSIVCSTAMLHGGAVLVDKTEDGTRITMSLQIKASHSNQVNSPILHWDYAGEYDHCLLELADVLPAQHYSVENIK